MFRVLTCKECAYTGTCVAPCKCDAIGRMNGINDQCSLDKWGPFMDKEKWNNFKELNQVTFKLISKNE